ncbi:cilia- and flagella-associated protein 61 isoform X2 [Ornithorhynchus anatinus]|uniref:Cilia and flagella associated protein 61 n=2 Tax=Ornithorhynchus anatinus TaxID=9258 RepID=A0A6I8PDW7_ORNAN|nr:cilia- and flagella-associated protein 61 isoform X2 [Ornithorhynchus anatinus]
MAGTGGRPRTGPKMTTLTSLRGKSEVVHARRTESQDVHCIKALVRNHTEKIFGRMNVIYLLEKTNLAITLCNEKEEIMAHAAFLDYPNWNVAKQDEWETVFHDLEGASACTPLNTLFLHLFVTVEEYAVGCCKEIISTTFKAVPELHFIYLLIPAHMNLGPTLKTVFEPVGCLPCLTFEEDFAVFVCLRQNYCPRLYIRKARLEDYDDLMPIFLLRDTTLQEIYGEYFLAELIASQDEENHTVVCEDGGIAVGLMSVCSQVNMKMLHRCFDLRTFHGLCRPHPDDVLKPSLQTEEKTSSHAVQKSESDESEPTALPEDSQVEAVKEDGLCQLPDDVAPAEASGDPPDDLKEAETESTISEASPSVRDDGDGDSRTAPPAPLPVGRDEDFHPVYRGASAAFCIQLFCIDEKHETRSLDFMQFVFSLFPEKDYCIISVPHLVPEFILIQNFVRVVPFSNCTLDQELYIFHRAGLLKSIHIRPAKTSDTPAVEKLIKTLVLNKSILDDLKRFNEARRDPDGTPVQAFVAEVLGQIVGISVIRNEMDIEYIRAHYNIEDFIYFSHHQREEHGHLHHFALNPIFKHYSKYFLKEILRLSFKSCLYYPVYPLSREGKFQNPSTHSLTSALHYMVPVRPRRQIVYPLEKLGINAPSKEVSKDQLKYALNHTNRKLMLEPKVTINARIVVVGASNVGISFLETLIFCPHLKFNNLILISIHGLPGKNLLGSETRRFLANDHCFNDEDYALMALYSWVNVVVGKMTAIDRAAKYVMVSKGKKVPYDHLVLCTGQQYQVPCPTGADISKLLTNRETSSKMRYTGPVPSNLFTLNDDEDCLSFTNWLKDNFIDSGGNVIVYGNTIDIYTTVETLLSLGINGSRIHIVQPPLSSNITCLNNYAVEKAIQETLEMADVTVYHDALLAQWNEGNHPDPITCASFTTPTKPFKIQCSAFISFYEKNVDFETFKALNDACLVYDGRLVIDTNFHTNDVTIRAAGPLTKFSSRYYANEWTHSRFSSKEIGFQLAAAMLSIFDPTLDPAIECMWDLDKLIPIYKGAKVQGGCLPGGYHYLHIAKPGIPTPLEVQITQPNFGVQVITGKAKKGNYFRIHINQYHLVETITCFSKKPFPVSNYICLFGQHEQVLNNLCTRYNEGLITDLYSYFREPWSMAVFHDRFIDLKKELREILAFKEDESLPSVEELARQVVDEELNLSEKPRKYLRRFFQENIHQSLAERSILAYLQYNNYHLPMYAWPGII